MCWSLVPAAAAGTDAEPVDARAREGQRDALDSGREPARPDLGPSPSIAIEVPRLEPEAPGEIVLKALATAGSGESENGKPQVRWEVYGPGQGVVLKSGEELHLEPPAGRIYRVRAAVAHVFGRPAAS
jgi:hypothetical protein